MSPARRWSLIAILLAILVGACDPFYTVTVTNMTSGPVSVTLRNGRGGGDVGSREPVRAEPGQTVQIAGVGGSALKGFPNDVTVEARNTSGALVYCGITDHEKNYSTPLEITQSRSECPGVRTTPQ